MMVAAPPVAELARVDDDTLAQFPTVFVVDPDPGTENTVRTVLQGYELTVQAFASGREFFSAYTADQPGCLVSEQRVFDISGMQIQRRLAEQSRQLPIVFVTSEIDVSTAVVLMRAGAIHVLQKPLRSIELLDAIQEAVAIAKKQRRETTWKRQVRESFALLTRKEREVLDLVAAAKSTKTIASDLNITYRAVELRRRNVMDKLGMTSPVELLRFAILARQECGEFPGSAPWNTSAGY